MTATEVLERRTARTGKTLTTDQRAQYVAARDRLTAESDTLAGEGDKAMLLSHQAPTERDARRFALFAVGRYAQASYRDSMARTYQTILDRGTET